MKQIVALGFLCLGLAAPGCTQRMVEPAASIGMTGEASLAQVTAAIQAAGVETAWRMTVVRPGLIEASREWGGGKHNMVIEITYDAKRYNIKYKSSKNLGYDGQTIHRSYDTHVKLLDNAIKSRTWRL